MIEEYQIGEFTLITLLDGIFLCGTEMIQAAASPEGEELFKNAGLPASGPSPEPINAFALKRNNELWLIDAGCGRELGPRFGKAADALCSAGYSLDQVQGVILSHLHEDHIGGLIKDDGTPLYPNATLFLSEEELAFWTDATSPIKYPRMADAGLFKLATSVLRSYEGAVQAIKAGEQVIPGVHLIPLHGHTPGHSGVQIESGDQQVLIWGDVIHSTLLQLRYPHWSIGFDVDPAQAVQTREQLLARLASGNTLVAGPHVTGIGKIRSCCHGGYKLDLTKYR
ncbi:TPA: MBL fold metallo-hydrolase [Burkholderia aenigmatica]|uniref:MBL fold metallo-hydrolase n=1 Tax=Burkholderia sp. AU45251 TaxID=3059204 RepID=UPI002653DDD0|nr:MBL fold metallo-hydrolase [Burkholderia sp. AU45251]HDR9482948.1 MBL fold metallo-hydrolase [Burkholderia aenigmatica]MDN7515812.1 MBL fold metallo-hydrolase [Burkholderia sp. AU45251]HDR9488483.1 MBL fold metallo-hydrolase [Burkholderia aenigmatica]HDR9513895.1 MBL fold metallo-hydrolase [Burkholderia aenigmatica]HDR9520663.1 MBL fold metallo-hydrolase [Burkholderia aenigmatica]